MLRSGPDAAPANSKPFRVTSAGIRWPIIGTGDGTYSFINLQDAAAATVMILGHETSGIYNIVDDSPVRLSEWLPFTAKLLGAPARHHVDEALAREKFGDMRVYYMNEQRGPSNAKASANSIGN